MTKNEYVFSQGDAIENLEQENEIIEIEIDQLQTDTTEVNKKVMENGLKIQEHSNSLANQSSTIEKLFVENESRKSEITQL